MFRSRRSFAWSLVLALLCASFVTAQQPIAHAAGATYTVTTTSDQFNDPNDVCSPTINPNALPGCTLRQALNAAATTPGSTVEFQISPSDLGFAQYPNSAAWIITPTIALPPLTASGTIIDGSTQTNRVGNTNNDGPEIIIDGKNVTNAGGLVIPVASSGNTIRGIGIVRFVGDSVPGSLKGVGIEIFGSNNTIEGNYIGLGVGPTGTVAIPNVDAGIIIYGQGNTVGGDATSITTKFNVISGNAGDGILVNGGINNNIAGNFIGTNGAITAAIPNGGNGIHIRSGGSGNTIGNYLALSNVSYRNFIGGNNGYGILISDSPSNKIYGNFVGLNRFGTSKISNGLGGIRIDGTSTNSSTSNIIGAIAPNPLYMRNYIAGNGGPGIQLNSFGARLNQIVANYIGIGSNNLVPGAGPQLSTGILLNDGSSDNTVGGTISTNAHNVVAGISGDGIKVAGLFLVSPPTLVRSRNNVVSGNYVGVRPDGVTPQGNAGAGIVLDTFVFNATVGGTTADQRNVIANNALDGIAIRGTNVATATIQKNTITSNTGNGINIDSASNTTITGGDAVGANLITSNGANGIKVTNSVTTTIQFNTIKLNAQNGVQVSGITNANTYIKSNTLNNNNQNGVQVDGQAFNTAITSSTIYSNTLNGVLVRDAGTVGTQRVKIFDNSMQGNAAGGNKKGIVLTPTGFSPTGTVTNPNHDIDPPYLMHIDQTGKLSGKIRLLPNNPAVSGCAQPCTIQIFTTNPQTLDTQGRDKVTATVSIVPDPTDPNIGNFSAPIGKVPPQLALTATDKDGNTSEFAVFTSTFGLDIGPPRTGTAIPGQVITYTHRITNTGTVDFTNIQFTGFSKLGWPFKLAPANPITLVGGSNASKPVTLTLTLPTGSDPRVRAGLIELTRLTVSATTTTPAVVTTASVTDTTTVLPKFILDASFKLGRKGSGAPGTVIDYTRLMTNTGNVTGTVTLGALTDLGWTTLITPTSVQLPPGKSIGVDSSVAIPAGAIAGTTAKTTLTFNGTATIGPPDPQRLVITDTTTVLLTPKATMVFNQQAQGNAGKTVVFCHTVTNLSNGAVTFSLTGVSSLGSKITFVSDTPGRQLVNGHTFTLGITDSDKSFNFCANVLIDPYAAKGQQDLVAIGLIDDQGVVVGGASVRDLIDIVGGLVLPRIYMPVIRR